MNEGLGCLLLMLLLIAFGIMSFLLWTAVAAFLSFIMHPIAAYILAVPLTIGFWYLWGKLMDLLDKVGL